jgi:hypothetical protein
MSAPALSVFANGAGPVTGDQLNTFMQSANTANDLRSFIGITGISVCILGVNTVNDGLGGVFYWNATSAGPDDGLNTIVPPNAKMGAWVRQTVPGTAAPSISTAMAPVVGASTKTAALGMLFAAGTLNANPSVSHAPVGNPPTTLGSLVMSGTTQSASLREFFVSLGLISSTGAGVTASDKVTLYAAVDGFAGSGDIWSINTVTTMESTFPANQNAQGYELDFNNMQGLRGGTSGIGGMAAPVATGLSISGASSFTSTTAITIVGGAGQWNRGVTIAPAVVQAAFADYSSAYYGIQMQANHSQYGIDMQGSALGAGMRFPNNASINYRNSGNTADLTAINIDTSNRTVVGGNTVGVVCAANTYPLNDNSIALGTGSNRWTAVYAVNGTIQTSDPTLKTDIQPLPEALPLLAAVNPVTFRWISGGYDVEEDEEERDVPATAPVDHEHVQRVLDGDRVIHTAGTRTVHAEVYDEYPVHDEGGDPVYTTVKQPDGTLKLARDDDGNLIQVRHPVLRMTKAKVPVQRLVHREGRRTHWGFLASDLKTAFDAAGLDWGGYVKAGGTEHIRPDQLIPVLWKATQELAARIETLEGKAP